MKISLIIIVAMMLSGRVEAGSASYRWSEQGLRERNQEVIMHRLSHRTHTYLHNNRQAAREARRAIHGDTVIHIQPRGSYRWDRSSTRSKGGRKSQPIFEKQ